MNIISAKNIVLVGFMGSGKSMTARKLAGMLKRKSVSTDRLVEQKEGRAITDIFADSGETYFRKVEKEVVKKVSAEKGIILDCGGGVVLDPDNMACLKRNGTVFFLSAPARRIYNNIKDQTHRPLLNVDDPQARIAELLSARQAFYEQADVTIDADQSIDGIVQDILKELDVH